MKPVIVIVGRPNVGKSTLFNRLTHSREALVADRPGLTRDRLYAIGKFCGRSCLVVDTGGIDEDADALKGLISDQTQRAIEEADSIIFLTDGREGLSPSDRNIADSLRRSGKTITVAVNKTEGMPGEIASADFFALGLGAPIPISAVHGNGVAGLMDTALRSCPPTPVDEEAETSEIPCIAIAGRPNVGKSTLVNRMLGDERVIVFDQPGTTRDSIRVPLERNGKRYILIDTAGVRRRARIGNVLEKFSVVKTLQAIEAANVVILVLDAQSGIGAQDAALAGFIIDTGTSMVLAVNKWDRLDRGRRVQIQHELDRKLPFLNFLEPHFISALHGSGVGELFPAVDRVYDAAMRNLATPRLNRVLRQAAQATPPPVVRGRRIKLKFAHQGGKNPPLILIHGNQVQQVPDAYRRYLSNVFRKAFKLEGTPVRIEFHGGVNPYVDQTGAGRRKSGRRPRPHSKRRAVH